MPVGDSGGPAWKLMLSGGENIATFASVGIYVQGPGEQVFSKTGLELLWNV